ncbi:hypothetical protein F4780DRAFT_726859 [Xylariomycetidae sp. FL0641]|nr:hypothetical protein F4780DRAFT_726859 [Xylariomycetidae sp. FL0641]
MPAQRPRTLLYAALFLALSLGSAWLSKIEPARHGVPAGFPDSLLPHLRTRLTGLAPLDAVLRLLVGAFIAGTAGWDDALRLQQAHFLTGLFPLVAVWSVEACRARNKGRLISFTSLFALLYQTQGGNIIIPLYCLAYVIISSPNDYYLSGREVPQSYARGLLFSNIVGYLVPTVMMYLPVWSFDTTQLLTAYWQFSPIFVNLLLIVCSVALSPSKSSEAAAARPKNADMWYLKKLYLLAGIVSFLVHITTLYICIFPNTPLVPSMGLNPDQISLSRVFVPSKATWKDNTSLGMHYIFQIDEWGIYAAALVWCWVVTYDYLRILLGDKLRMWQLVLSAINITGLALLLGPGTVLALVFDYREDRLVLIEEGFRGALKKPKSKTS